MFPPRGGHCLDVAFLAAGTKSGAGIHGHTLGPSLLNTTRVRFVLFGGMHCGVPFSDVWHLDLDLSHGRSKEEIRMEADRRLREADRDGLVSHGGMKYNKHFLQKARSKRKGFLVFLWRRLFLWDHET